MSEYVASLIINEYGEPSGYYNSFNEMCEADAAISLCKLLSKRNNTSVMVWDADGCGHEVSVRVFVDIKYNALEE